MAKSLYFTPNQTTSSHPWTMYSLASWHTHLPASALGPHPTSLPCSPGCSQAEFWDDKNLNVSCRILYGPLLRPPALYSAASDISGSSNAWIPLLILKRPLSHNHPQENAKHQLPISHTATHGILYVTCSAFPAQTSQHNLQNYTSDYAKAPQGPSDFSFQDCWHRNAHQVSLFDSLLTSHLMKHKLQVGRTSLQLLTCHCIY